MVAIVAGSEPLKRMFAALTEDTFQSDFGVADPKLLDYLADLLFRFMRMDAIYRFRDLIGRRLEEVAEMLLEAEARSARPQRDLHRHIGDFTLFWSGVFPEHLRKLQAADRQDHLLDYTAAGKRSYRIASGIEDDENPDRPAVLRRLSDEFELCTTGLRRVREQWERRAA